MQNHGVRVIAACALVAVAAEAAKGQGNSLEELLATPVNAASLYAQTAAQAPGAITIVTSDDIRRYGWTTLEDVLAWTRGFHVTNDRNYSYIGVRGFSLPTDYNNRLLLLVDGHRVNDDFYGSVPAGNDLGLDLSRVERIEVIRGAGSSLYGSNAMFAVINLVTKDDERAWVAARAGSWDTRATSAGIVSSLGGLSFEVSGSYARTSGEDLYFREFGAVQGLDGEEATSAAIRASWKGFELTSHLVGRSKDIPTAPWGSAPGDQRTNTYDELVWLNLEYAPRLGPATQLEINATLDHYDYEGAYPDSTTLYADMNEVNTVGVAAHVRHDVRANNRLVVGGDVRHTYQAVYRSWDDEVVYFDRNFPYTTASAFIQDEHDITPELSVLAGFRFDASGLGYSHLSPRASLVWAPRAATRLKLVFGDAFRAPTVYERYYTSPTFRSVELAPERSRMGEVILEQRLGSNVQAYFSAFAADIRGLIETTEDSAGIGQFRNGTSASTRGIETEIQARRDGYHAFIAYSYAHAHADHRDATNSPSHIVRMGLGAPVLSHLGVGLLGRWESSRLTVQETRTPSFFLADLSVSVPEILPGLTARLNIRNLLDAEVVAPGGFEHVQAALPQPGRRLEGALEYEF